MNSSINEINASAVSIDNNESKNYLITIEEYKEINYLILDQSDTKCIKTYVDGVLTRETTLDVVTGGITCIEYDNLIISDTMFPSLTEQNSEVISNDNMDFAINYIKKPLSQNSKDLSEELSGIDFVSKSISITQKEHNKMISNENSNNITSIPSDYVYITSASNWNAAPKLSGTMYNQHVVSLKELGKQYEVPERLSIDIAAFWISQAFLCTPAISLEFILGCLLLMYDGASLIIACNQYVYCYDDVYYDYGIVYVNNEYAEKFLLKEVRYRTLYDSLGNESTELVCDATSARSYADMIKQAIETYYYQVHINQHEYTYPCSESCNICGVAHPV